MVGREVAKSFAMAPLRCNEPAFAIRPLPDALYRACDMAASPSSWCWPVPFPEMREGDWSIVVINECDPDMEEKDKHRLAVVTLKDSCYRAISLKAYLEDVISQSDQANHADLPDLIGLWEQNTGFVDFCRSEESQALLSEMKQSLEVRRQSGEFERISKYWESRTWRRH